MLVAIATAAGAHADVPERDQPHAEPDWGAGRPREPEPGRLEANSHVEFHFALSPLWATTATESSYYGQHQGLGLASLELGIGGRPTDSVAVAVFARAGLAHAGGGLEVVVLPGGSWSRSGPSVRLAVVVLADGVTCLHFDSYPGQCAAPTIYALAEVGFGYRWRLQRGAFSLGVALQAGSQALSGSHGPADSLVLGVLGPRMELGF